MYIPLKPLNGFIENEPGPCEEYKSIALWPFHTNAKESLELVFIDWPIANYVDPSADTNAPAAKDAVLAYVRGPIANCAAVAFPNDAILAERFYVKNSSSFT